MDPFPQFDPPRVALVHAEFRTGIVLDLARNYWRRGTPSQKHLIFSDLTEAKSYADQVITSDPEIECIIYNHLAQEVLIVRPPTSG